jgi:hypothetical protein
MSIARVISTVVSIAALCGCAGSGTALKAEGPPASVSQNSSTCPRDTGSRIPASSADCSGFGRTYSSDDINRTGSTTAAGALRLLDPSITTH